MKFGAKASVVALGAVLSTASPAWANFDPTGSDAPPQLVERANQLVAQRNYRGVEELISQIDAQYENGHSLDYFRALLGIRRSIGGWKPYPAAPDYPRIWLLHKIQWKLLLVPYSHIEDALVVQNMKDGYARFGAPNPLGEFDTDQFVALRNDALAMLMAYRDSLRSLIVPNYQYPRGHSQATVPLDSKDEELGKAKRAAEEAELTRNDQKSLEQIALQKSLLRLGDAALWLVKEAYCWPPEDDVAVTQILNVFPPPGGDGGRQSILADLAAARRQKLAELKSIEERRKALPAAAH